MSNRAEHDLVGIIAETSLAVFQGREQSGGCLCLETRGGALGGLAGRRLQDIFDPPTHPGHRALAHGVVPMGSLGIYVAGQLTHWQEQVHAWADGIAGAHASNPPPAAVLLAAALRIATGFVAVYVSHLVRDACTVRSLAL